MRHYYNQIGVNDVTNNIQNSFFSFSTILRGFRLRFANSSVAQKKLYYPRLSDEYDAEKQYLMRVRRHHHITGKDVDDFQRVKTIVQDLFRSRWERCPKKQ